MSPTDHVPAPLRLPSLIVASLLALTGLGAALPDQVRAEGAVAAGIPADVARDGATMAIQVNAKSAEEARRLAVENCRKSKASPKGVQLCKVVAEFKNKCAALSLDPKDGTPGAGWAVGATRVAAEKTAMERCRATAGPTRRQFCKITGSNCDGTAK